MTILEALKSKVKYPLSEDFFQSVLIERGLFSAEEFTAEIATGKEFKLCRADMLVGLLDAVNEQEGNYSISLTEKGHLLNLANSIYRECGEPEYGAKESPTVTFLKDW